MSSTFRAFHQLNLSLHSAFRPLTTALEEALAKERQSQGGEGAPSAAPSYAPSVTVTSESQKLLAKIQRKEQRKAQTKGSKAGDKQQVRAVVLARIALWGRTFYSGLHLLAIPSNCTRQF